MNRRPRWTEAEIATLRQVYPAGGLVAAQEALPGRPRQAIYVKANKLGIHTEHRQYPRGKFVQDMDRALELRRSGLSYAAIGRELGVCEATATNAVMAAECLDAGHRPIERDPSGKITDAGRERLRLMLRKGWKGRDIQVFCGVAASTISRERRLYDAELKARGKAPLPPPGGGERYSGAKIPMELRREVERLYLEGFGAKKISQATGVSNTHCLRIRDKLVKRLRRKGESLPGCDGKGVRRWFRDHARSVVPEQRERFKALLLDRVPVRRAAGVVGISTCSAYKIRDALKAEGLEIPKPKLPGHVSSLRAEMMNAQAIAPEHQPRFKILVREHGFDDAKRILREEIKAARRELSFEEKLELVASGKAMVVAVPTIRSAAPRHTLGGVATGQLG